MTKLKGLTMRISRLTIIGIFATSVLMAEDHNVPAHEAAQQALFNEGNAQRASRTMKLKRDDVNNVSSLSTFEIFTGLTIAPGQTLNLFGSLDWTGADSASIAIACPASTSLQNVQVLVYWNMPALSSIYTATNVVLGSTFAFKNMGGEVVPVFGAFFGLQVKNASSTVVTCDQLTVYGVVR
jgi:hypothetical protein